MVQHGKYRGSCTLSGGLTAKTMTRLEFLKKMDQIDPDGPYAVDELAPVLEEYCLSSGDNLNDPETAANYYTDVKADLKSYMDRYDFLLEKLHKELRKAGATEAQINWDLFGNVELGRFAWLRCNRMAKALINLSYEIRYCLAELKMLSKYTDQVDLKEIARVQREYRNRYGWSL